MYPISSPDKTDSSNPSKSGGQNYIATEAQDRQRTYAFYVKGLIKGALKNLGAGIGGQNIEV